MKKTGKNKKGLGVAPLVVAAGQQIMQNPETREQAKGVVTMVVKQSISVMKIIAYITIGMVTILLARKFYKVARYNNWRKKAASDVNIQAAITIYEAVPEGLKKGKGSFFNPAGFIADLANKIALLWTTTATTTILDAAKKITKLETTRKAFKIFYEMDLYELLHKVFTQTEYNTFINTANEEKNPYTTTLDNSIKGMVAVTKNQTIGRYYWISGSSIYYHNMETPVPENSFVGRATGKIYKEKTSGVKYMELYINKNSKFYFMYLPKDNLKTLSDTAYAAATSTYSTTWTLGHVKVTLEQNPGGAMKQQSPQLQSRNLWKGEQCLFTNKKQVNIYDMLSLQLVAVIEEWNTLLGKFIAVWQDYYVFQALNGQNYLVKSIDVIIKTL